MSDSVLKRIDIYYSAMSKGHKRIADFIKNNFEKASFMTAASLGKAVNVSESTVVRFASGIGFNGYPELQKKLQETVKIRLTSVQRIEASKRFDGSGFLEQAFSSDIDMLKKTRDTISREAFAGAVKAISNAKKIYILGVRSSASLASFAALYLSVLYDVTMIDTSATSEMFEQMLRIGEEDVCIAISFPRYSTRTVNVLKFARSRGAQIISITDGEMSPIAEYADHLLVAQSDMVSFVDSLVAPLSVITALIAASASEKQEKLHSSLEELEAIWEEYDVYNTGGEDK